MTDSLRKTPLHRWHSDHKARLVDFAGWSMPIQYTSIVEEHQATRNGVTLFDVSHMGRLRFEGDGSTPFLDRMVTRRVVDMKPGAIRYATVTNEQGGILDDVLVYYLEGSAGPYHQLVVNASNREKIVAWLNTHLQQFGLDNVKITDRTEQTAMIAVQGPRAVALAGSFLDVDLAGMKYYSGLEGTFDSVACLVSRTGYTGEDGCELIVAAEDAVDVWTKLLDAGESVGIRPAGLAARDTLRLEAAMPLYGHELSEEINPIQAGLGFALNLKDHDFVGRDAIAQIKEAGNHPQRIGLEMSGRKVPREGYPILLGSQKIGEVTSGTHSPTLGKPIAMGYIDPAHAATGTELVVDIRGKQETAKVVPLPFYKRSS